MKRLSAVTAGLVIAFSVFGCSYMPGQSDASWTTLIDGTAGLDNFNPIGEANWRAEDGAIVADKGKGGYLVSKNSYKDFQIRAEFWADHTTNSGVFIRITDPNKITAVFNGVQTVNVQDSKHAQGPFALQFGNRANDAPGGAIKWRKVQIKPL